MKRIAIILSALLLTAAPGAFAQKEGNFYLGPSIGIMDGVGLEIAMPLSQNFSLRAGYSILPKFIYSYQKEFHVPAFKNIPETDINIKAFPNSGNGNVLLDIYPYSKGTFHITAGVFFGNGTIASVCNTNRLDSSFDDIYLNVHENDSEDPEDLYMVKISNDGYFNADLKRNMKVAPYLGFGTGKCGRKASVIFDLGVMYTGGLGIYADGSNFVTGETKSVRFTSSTIGTDGSGQLRDKGWLDAAGGDVWYFNLLPMARLTVLLKLF